MPWISDDDYEQLTDLAVIVGDHISYDDGEADWFNEQVHTDDVFFATGLITEEEQDGTVDIDIGRVLDTMPYDLARQYSYAAAHVLVELLCRIRRNYTPTALTQVIQQGIVYND